MNKKKLSAVVSFVFLASFAPTVSAAQTTPPTATYVVNNNYGVPDVVTITGSEIILNEGELINIYTTSTATSPDYTTQAAVTTSCSGISIPLDTDGTTLGETSGNIYITFTNENEGGTESGKVTVPYSSQKTQTLTLTQVKATNNYGANDEISITGGCKKDAVVTVYGMKSDKTIDEANILATTTAAIDASSVNPVKINGFQGGENGGYIYLKTQELHKSTSAAIKLLLKLEPKTVTNYLQTLKNNIIVTNKRTGLNDTVEIKGGLKDGDVVKVYNKVGTGYVEIASTTNAAIITETTVAAIAVKSTATTTTTTNPPAPTGTTTSMGISFNLPVDALDENKSGSIYITIKNTDALESNKFTVSYKNAASAPLVANNVQIFNDEGSDDYIRVKGLSEEDEVYVWDAIKSDGTGGMVDRNTLTTTNAIAVNSGSNAVAEGRTGITLNLPLPSIKIVKNKALTKGTVYIGVRRNGLKLSTFITKDYIPEQ